MRTESDSNKIYLGLGAGKKFVLSYFSKAKKSIKAVSPYIQPSYIEELLKYQARGVNVTLVTVDKIDLDKTGRYSHLEHKDIVRQKQHKNDVAASRRSKGLKFTTAASILSVLIAYLLLRSGIKMATSFYIVSGLVLLIAFYYFYHIKIYTYSYYTPFKRLRIFFSPYKEEDELTENFKDKYPQNHFVHSKVYVIDDEVAFLGSCNLTHPGMSSNYETLVEVCDPKAVRQISEEVDRLCDSDHLPYLDIAAFGRKLYKEQPH